ncbi:conserved Plasmodium protein, unknown function [Plasmodium sp. gorilla clade G2]|uniref:conserved Plasmodium protein, unknown function n=1 Tax=Plasmodium sp. gorilla clade G2 TaxID=880535 RepID=UPI000D216417|nr:conserved Plasmodium protein, unknown function [Plasmodium sp. gorilla clade G2]SOV17355.1 conserved Plasmodium protein, unknown function [Plasmodium sp. gorilla clade G2]
MKLWHILFEITVFSIINIILNSSNLCIVICFMNGNYLNKTYTKGTHNNKTYNILNIYKTKDAFKLYMTKKFKYKYRNTLEKRIKKGQKRNEIYQKLKKKHSAYIVITEKLSKLDPNQEYFKYDKNILKEYENIPDIYKNKKLGRKFNQYDYWYSSKKKEAKYNYSRHVNFAITENKFNFKNVFSYFHILEIVHEKFKNNSFYINGLQSFINKYYDPITQKRIKFYDKIKEMHEMKSKKGEHINDENNDTDNNAKKKLDNIDNNNKMDSDKDNSKDISKNNKDTSLNEELKQNDEHKERKNLSKLDMFEIIKMNIDGYMHKNEVNPEDSSFTLFGSNTSCLLKKKRSPVAYDISCPFRKSPLSSKRRRQKEKKLFDIINFNCKTRKERLMLNAVKRLSIKKLKGEDYILDATDRV